MDTARRADLGHTLAEHRRELGALLAPLTEVAAAQPEHAWFPVARTAEEITTPSADNRMVATPYTKLMTAIMDVDMAAAVLVATAAEADRLGVPTDRRVYLRGLGCGRRAAGPGRPARPRPLAGPGRGGGLRPRAATPSTTSPTSTSTPASPARWRSPRTPSASPRAGA